MTSLAQVAVDVPAIDLLTQWSRCRSIAAFVAQHLAQGHPTAPDREGIEEWLTPWIEEQMREAEPGMLRIEGKHHGDVVEVRLRLDERSQTRLLSVDPQALRRRLP